MKHKKGRVPNKPTPPKMFCGVDALVKRLSTLAMETDSQYLNNEINNIVSELYLLDAALGLLLTSRTWGNIDDVDRFIKRLRAV